MRIIGALFFLILLAGALSSGPECNLFAKPCSTVTNECRQSTDGATACKPACVPSYGCYGSFCGTPASGPGNATGTCDLFATDCKHDGHCAYDENGATKCRCETNPFTGKTYCFCAFP